MTNKSRRLYAKQVSDSLRLLWRVLERKVAAFIFDFHIQLSKSHLYNWKRKMVELLYTEAKPREIQTRQRRQVRSRRVTRTRTNLLCQPLVVGRGNDLPLPWNKPLLDKRNRRKAKRVNQAKGAPYKPHPPILENVRFVVKSTFVPVPSNSLQTVHL